MPEQKGSNGLSMQIMPTHLDYADDIYEDDDYPDSEDDDEYYDGGKTKISPRKQKKKVPRHLRRPKPNCCKRICKRVTNRLVFGYHDKELEKVVSEYKIRDQHVGIRELSSFEESHSVRHIADGEKDHKERNGCCPILPYSRTRATLDFMLIICVFIDALYIPFSVALIDSDTQLWTYQLIAESVIDCIFVIDWLSYMFTAYIAHDGAIEVRLRYILCRYINSWKFVFYLICAFPFQLLEYFNQTSFKGYKLISMVRILRLTGLFSVLFQWARGSAVLDGIMSEFKYSKQRLYLKLCRAITIILICLHFAVCWWIYLYRMVAPSEYMIWTENALSVQVNATSEKAISEIYLSSLDTVLSLLIGNRGTVEQSSTPLLNINGLLYQFLGFFAMAFVLAQIVSIVLHFNEREHTFHEKMVNIKRTMEYLRLPRMTQFRVNKYYEFVWSQFGGFDPNIGNALGRDLSDPLQAEICLYLHRKHMQEISLFNGVDHRVIKSLVNQFHVEIYLPGDNIILAGEFINKLYVIVRGRCEIVDAKDDTIVIKLLKENDFFGETSLLHGSTCERTVRSATYCVINVLTRNSFNSVRKNHPEFGQSLDATIMKKFVNTTS
eukprot:g14643.t1